METSISKFFSKVKDPRINRKKLYPLEEILVVALSCIVCGGEGFSDMVLYGKNKLDLLRKIYPFKNGIPSVDTFRRVFMLLHPEVFKECFVEWVNDLQQRGCGGIAIDGKVARRTVSKDQKALHLVSAWAHDQGLVLAQQRVEDKSNEINAIPDLLDILDIKGCVVSIDAIGCQKTVTKKIVDKEGDYVLAVKDNQKKLHKELEEVFSGRKTARFVESLETKHKTTEKGHGRLETRKYRAISVENLPIAISDWVGIQSIIEVESTREKGAKKTHEKRYYISSLTADAKKIGQLIRGHWGIENSLHWVLDVTFNEDQSRIRSGHAAENLAIMRHTSLNLLKRDESKGSIRGKRKKAGWNDDYLLQILLHS